MVPARRSSRVAIVTVALLLFSAGIAFGHDLFLKPAQFFVAENAVVLVRALNGTFSQSENAVARARLRDLSIVSPSGRTQLDTSEWNATGDTSAVRVRTGTAGTYLVAASTKPNVIALKAKDFNEYLASDGIPDVLEARRRDKELQRDARERYSKHVKALIQVGATRSDNFAAELEYPAELVPLDNPYGLRVGGVLRVRTMVDGKLAQRQYVLFGGRAPNGGRIAQRNVRSDGDGVARIPLRAPGTWYVKFINMIRVAGDTVDYESKWATITFQVR